MANRSVAKRPPRGPAVGLHPVPGYYRTKLGGRGSPWVPARIFYGAPLDPNTSEPLDRPHRIVCLVAGEEHDPLERWPMHPIDRAEYEQLLAALPDDPLVPRDLSKDPPLW